MLRQIILSHTCRHHTSKYKGNMRHLLVSGKIVPRCMPDLTIQVGSGMHLGNKLHLMMFSVHTIIKFAYYYIVVSI